MLDFIMLILVVVCFALAKAYTDMCERLASPAGEDESL
jgi:hypothetical protein